MWDKINKMQIVNVLAMLTMLTCSFVIVVAVFQGIDKNKEIIRDFFQMGLLAVYGWAFTRSKKTES